MPCGYWTSYAYVGYMPNGTKRWFVSYEEYAEAYRDEAGRDKTSG